MIEHLFQSLLPSIEHFRSLANWVAFVVSFAETALVVGLLLPGSTLLLILGALSAPEALTRANVVVFSDVCFLCTQAETGSCVNDFDASAFIHKALPSGLPRQFIRAHVC